MSILCALTLALRVIVAAMFIVVVAYCAGRAASIGWYRSRDEYYRRIIHALQRKETENGE